MATLRLNEHHSDQSNKLHDFPITELVLSGRPFRAKVDTADLPKILSIATRWHASWDEDSKTYYVRARKNTSLHRVITDCPKGMTVDHWNHDGLNNCRSNLRVVTQSVNSRNTRRKTGVTGLHGVTRRGRKFRASVMVNRKRVVLGHWQSAESASRAVSEYLSSVNLKEGTL